MNLGTLWNRIQMIFRRGHLTKNSDNTGSVQVFQVYHNELDIHDVPSYQHYGFASAPLAGADVMRANMAGSNSSGVIIASNDRRYRPLNLSDGETRIYNNQGVYISLNGTNVVVSTPGKVTVQASEAEFNCVVKAPDFVTTGGISLKNHRHVETGSTTQQPSQ